MRNMAPLESFAENFVVNFPGSQFQAQQASMNLLAKSRLLRKKPAKKNRVLAQEKLDEVRVTLEHVPQQSP
jgi:hypothetical protein